MKYKKQQKSDLINTKSLNKSKYKFTKSFIRYNNQSELINIMQTAKQTLLFKHFSYQIEINPMGQKKLAITIVDSASKSEYFEKQLLLQQIGVSTLIKAFQKNKKQITFSIQPKKGGQIQMIELKVQVDSQFLRPVQETIYIKKIRQVSQAEALKKSIDYLNKKIKDLKASEEVQKKDGLILNKVQGEKSFAAGNNFQTFSEITIPKGKYLITWTFLAKATNQLMYIYLNQGQVALLTNCAVYVPNQQNFIPFTFRKVHTVGGNEQTLSLQTYCTQSYPVTFANIIVTAKRID